MSVKTRLSTILLFASNPCSECKVENNDLRASLYGNLDVDIEAQIQFNISSGNKVDEKRNDAEDGVHKFLELSEIPSSVCVKIRTWLSRAPCRSRIIRQADRKVQRRTTFTWLVSHPVRDATVAWKTSTRLLHQADLLHILSAEVFTAALVRSNCIFLCIQLSFLLTIDDKNSVKKWNERVCLFVCAWKLFVFIIRILSLPGASKKRWSASLSFLSFANRFTKPWDSFVDVSNASFHLFTNWIRVGFTKKSDDTSAAYCFDQSRSRVARNRPLRTFPSILFPRS